MQFDIDWNADAYQATFCCSNLEAIKLVATACALGSQRLGSYSTSGDYLEAFR